MTVSSVQRVCLRLDPAMLLEGLLLAQLSRIPKGRRQEWLRGLLVQGYLWEGRTHRGVQRNVKAHSFTGDQAEDKGPVSAMVFAGWLTRPQPAMPRIAPEGTVAPRIAPIMPETHETRKPFAHLRKVIG